MSAEKPLIYEDVGRPSFKMSVSAVLLPGTQMITSWDSPGRREWLSAGTKGPRWCDWAFIEASDRAVTNGCSRIVLLDIPESELPPRPIRYRAFPDPHTVTFCNELPRPV